MTESHDFESMLAFAQNQAEVVRTTHLTDEVYELEMRLEGGRTQVAIVAEMHEEDGAAVVVMYSFIGAAEPIHYESALRSNSELRYGRIAVVDHGEEPMLAVVHNALVSELESQEFVNGVLELARTADDLEHIWFGGDTE